MSQLFSGQDNSKNINQYQSNSYKTTIDTKDKITKIFMDIKKKTNFAGKVFKQSSYNLILILMKRKIFILSVFFQFLFASVLTAQNEVNNTFVCIDKTPYPEEFVIELWSEEFGMVKRIESDSYTLELPLNGVIPGNYILRMTSKDGIILSTSQLIINQF